MNIQVPSLKEGVGLLIIYSFDQIFLSCLPMYIIRIRAAFVLAYSTSCVTIEIYIIAKIFVLP
jgi:hypothetical protein